MAEILTTFNIFPDPYDTCPPGFEDVIETSGYCYRHAGNEETFSSAKEVCESVNGSLINIQSQFSNYVIASYFNQQPWEDKAEVWIGLHQTCIL